jgi:hypothetical protein
VGSCPAAETSLAGRERLSPGHAGTPHPADGFFDPCVPTLAAKPPWGPDWIHEIKHDGYRLIVRRDGEAGANAGAWEASAFLGPKRWRRGRRNQNPKSTYDAA